MLLFVQVLTEHLLVKQSQAALHLIHAVIQSDAVGLKALTSFDFSAVKHLGQLVLQVLSFTLMYQEVQLLRKFTNYWYFISSK